MKRIALVLFIASLFFSSFSNAQSINWAALKKDQKHIASVHTGADYAFTYGAAYGYQLKSKLPVILMAGYSFPSGNAISDDFKSELGAQANWYQSKNFYISSKLLSIFRRVENTYARLLNFGAGVSATAGFYKKHWFAAGEIGFDKAIITHFKHTDLYKANFPAVKDGWYEPSTGGNFYYGITAGYSFKDADIYLRTGKLIQQDFKTSPMLPFYAELGLNLKFR